MKTLMHFAIPAALVGMLFGAKLIAQTSARVAAKSSVAEPMEIRSGQVWRRGLKAGLGTSRSIRPLAGGRYETLSTPR